MGPHVTAAIDAIEAAGLTVDVGPFGSQVTGDVDLVLGALSNALRSAIDAGASRVNLNVSVLT